MFVISRKDGLGNSETVGPADLMLACERLSQGGKHGLDIQPVAPAAPINSTFTSLVVDEAAKRRIEGQQAALIASGVQVDATQQFYATGTRMADNGYETQAARKVEHDAKASLKAVCDELRDRVFAEKRVDRQVTARELGAAIQVNGKISAFGLKLTEQAIRGLSARLESPMLGYVLGLRERVAEECHKPQGEPNLDAIQADKRTIARILAHECHAAGDTLLQLRTREGLGDIFACLSPGYENADFPQVAAELLSELPHETRATFAYNPEKTQWEVRAHVWTPTPTAQQAVGEAFEGYISCKSRDNGTSKWRSEGQGGGGFDLRA